MVRLAVAVLSVPVQALALVWLVASAVQTSNVGQGCGWDGTCTENGLFGAAISTLTTVPLVQLLVGAGWWWLGLPSGRRLRPAPEDRRALLTFHLAWTFIGGCLLAWLALPLARLFS